MLVRRYRDMETIKQFVVDSTKSSRREYVECRDNLDKVSSQIRVPLGGLEDVVGYMSEIDGDFCGFKKNNGIHGCSVKCQTMMMYSRAAYILVDRLGKEIQKYMSPSEEKEFNDCVADSHKYGVNCDYKSEIGSLRKIAVIGKRALDSQVELTMRLKSNDRRN